MTSNCECESILLDSTKKRLACYLSQLTAFYKYRGIELGVHETMKISQLHNMADLQFPSVVSTQEDSIAAILEHNIVDAFVVKFLKTHQKLQQLGIFSKHLMAEQYDELC